MISLPLSHLPWPCFFGDDAKCIMPISSVSDCSLLQDDLSRVVKWSTTWNLLLNEDKCSIIQFTSSRSPLIFNYLVNGKEIPSKSTQRDLGIVVSSNYQWSNHYQVIISKAYIKKTRNVTKDLLRLYCSICQAFPLFISCTFTTFILFSTLASSPVGWHQSSWVCSEKSHQVYCQWLIHGL